MQLVSIVEFIVILLESLLGMVVEQTPTVGNRKLKRYRTVLHVRTLNILHQFSFCLTLVPIYRGDPITVKCGFDFVSSQDRFLWHPRTLLQVNRVHFEVAKYPDNVSSKNGLV